jgi:hypothetical protein
VNNLDEWWVNKIKILLKNKVSSQTREVTINLGYGASGAPPHGLADGLAPIGGDFIWKGQEWSFEVIDAYGYKR